MLTSATEPFEATEHATNVSARVLRRRVSVDTKSLGNRVVRLAFGCSLSNLLAKLNRKPRPADLSEKPYTTEQLMHTLSAYFHINPRPPVKAE